MIMSNQTNFRTLWNRNMMFSFPLSSLTYLNFHIGSYFYAKQHIDSLFYHSFMQNNILIAFSTKRVAFSVVMQVNKHRKHIGKKTYITHVLYEYKNIFCNTHSITYLGSVRHVLDKCPRRVALESSSCWLVGKRVGFMVKVSMLHTN